MRRTIFLAVVAVGFAAGCAHTIGIPVQVLRPAEINMNRYKQIAVGGIQGSHGAEMTGLVQQRLVDSNRFTVVDRQNLERVLREQGLASSDLADPRAAVKLGKLLPSAALVFGRVDENYSENVSSSEGTCTSSTGKTKRKCYTNTRVGKAVVRGTFTVTDVETGAVLRTKVIPCELGASTEALDKQPAAIDAQALLSECREGVAQEFLKSIVPYRETVYAPFQEDSDLPQIQQGINFAKLGKWDDAIEKFLQAVETVSANPKTSGETAARAYFNLGLAYEYSGRYDEALKHVEQAYSLQPEEVYLLETREIKRRIAEKRKLEEQLGPGASAAPGT